MIYLEYTNTVLQAVNEVPLTSQQFGATRGLQQFAKDAVLRSYLDIMGEFKWPWKLNDVTHNASETLELSGEKSIDIISQWTDILVDNPYKDSVDWATIYLTDKDDKRHRLPYISWDQYEDHKDYYDTNAKVPRYIVQSADGRKMGLVPYDEEFTGRLFYRSWSRPTLYSGATDVIDIPDIHYPVVVDGALHHMWTFRGDVEQAQIAYQRYTAGIKTMKIKYSNQTPRMRWV